MLSIILIYQQGYYIHMFDGKVEIRRYLHNKIIMLGLEYENLSKLKDTSICLKNYSFLSHQEEGKIPWSHEGDLYTYICRYL